MRLVEPETGMLEEPVGSGPMPGDDGLVDLEEVLVPDSLDIPLSCADIHEAAAARPEWRFVKGIPGSSDACCPLRFEYSGGKFVFPADLTGTHNHRHALCEELLDAAGPEPPEDERFDAPMFLDINALPEDAEPFTKMKFDASAKWIKLYTDKKN